jgi:hypothetical protein
MDYPAGVVSFTYLPAHGTVITADYLYHGQLGFDLAAPVLPESETIYMDGEAQTRDVDYFIDNFGGAISFPDYPPNGAVFTADYTAAQWEFPLRHAPIWNDIITVYMDGEVQALGADYTYIGSTGMVMFTFFPEDGAVITADYEYSPTIHLVGKVKNEGDIPMQVRVRFDITRDDGRIIVLRSGQTYFGGGLGEPRPFQYLYVDEFNEWYYEWEGDPTNLFGEPDGAYIQGNNNAEWASLYSFEAIDLAGKEIADITLEGYTQYPNGATEAVDIDIYDVSGGFSWWGSLYGTPDWGWSGVRWTSDTVLQSSPWLADQDVLNDVQVLVYNYHGDAPDVPRLDSMRLKVEFANIIPVTPPIYTIQPNEETKIDAAIWTITPEHLGTYECTATIEYTADGFKWNSWNTKQSSFSFRIHE